MPQHGGSVGRPLLSAVVVLHVVHVLHMYNMLYYNTMIHMEGMDVVRGQEVKEGRRRRVRKGCVCTDLLRGTDAHEIMYP